MLNDRERGGRGPALHIRVWGLRDLPARGGRVTWSRGRTGFFRGKRSASSGRRRPRRANKGRAGSSPGSGEVDGGGQALTRGVGAGVNGCVREDIHGFDGGEKRRWWQWGDQMSGVVPVALAMGFPTVRATGRGGNAAVQGGLEVALLRAEGVGAAML